jgi:zona occludens toxin (predicted ATPase)
MSNGGFPISCAKEAAATIAQNHSYENREPLVNEDIFELFFTNQTTKERPTTETSKLWVSRSMYKVRLEEESPAFYLVDF